MKALAVVGKVPALDVLRALAILLVTNSHLDAIYPDARMSTGGAFGNALFFFISGWGLALGIGPTSAFGPWIARRLLRIYVPLWTAVALIALIAPGHVTRHDLPWLQTWVWPTWYWFVSAIVLFYPPYFALARRFGANGLAVAALSLVPLYVWLYLHGLDLSTDSLEAGRFKWIFYAQTMLLGGWFALRGICIARPGIWLAASVIGFIAFKLSAASLGLMGWQWLIHLDVAVFTVSLVSVVSAWCGRPGAARWHAVAAFFGSFAFEVYLVQELFNHDPWIVELGFPLSFAVFWLACLPSAWLLKQIHEGLRRTALALWQRLNRSADAAPRGQP